MGERTRYIVRATKKIDDSSTALYSRIIYDGTNLARARQKMSKFSQNNKAICVLKRCDE